MKGQRKVRSSYKILVGGPQRKTGVDIVRGMVNEITVYCTNVKETWLHRNGNWENNDAV